MTYLKSIDRLLDETDTFDWFTPDYIMPERRDVLGRYRPIFTTPEQSQRQVSLFLNDTIPF